MATVAWQYPATCAIYMLTVIGSIFMFAYFGVILIEFLDLCGEERNKLSADREYSEEICKYPLKQVRLGAVEECKIRGHRLSEEFWIHPLETILKRHGAGALFCGKGGCSGLFGPIAVLACTAAAIFACNYVMCSKWRRETVKREINPARFSSNSTGSVV